ncbi:triphosphoribosyl-dephospho-CoA synthase MdcB [Bordetella genomosp. 8]|uniref:Probable 2-(5''-triphosphoribosyl)-3'-dephosphocoenzyme-A synthase n=1 Tax=Bordetella genomosp. 8 TaxID=1416806 RepID=A0A1W6YNI5_9BORD|nr:triphosphoribosyl-dephospho-CoA synthase [Bordetella genomosp. 8]ARP82660.1 triphosphoribosyl-dephospho-CoA synthase MdcB [Bordetella genomosp. 8]
MDAICTQTRARDTAAYLAGQAVEALIDEATLAPKPGLVDIRSRGAHKDLNWSLMCLSAHTLRPTFQACAHAVRDAADARGLRQRIGSLGRAGEAAMLAATKGVNTHRGAIWALGLLVTAAALPGGWRADRICASAGALARLRDDGAPERTGHKGERARLAYGVGGAKGQAQADFPHVLRVALPQLWRSRARGDAENACRLNALVAIMADLDDTCVLARGGRAALAYMQHAAAEVLAAGGAGQIGGRAALRRLEQGLLDIQVSPGGAADLLAAALFLDRLERAGDPPSASIENGAMYGSNDF